jgi:hypothetical protein
MPDWSKVALGRASNAVKALELLVNTGGTGYEFTEQEAMDMFSDIDEALAAAKQAYVDRVPDLLSTTSIQEARPTAPAMQNSEAITIATSHKEAEEHATTVNTRSDMPLIVPHWAQVKDFVTIIPPNHLPSYILHIGDRMYEDALEISQK